jgi:hypothetical protein
MKKMFLLLFIFAAISASAHAAIQYKVEVVSTRFEGKITVSDGTTNQVCSGQGNANTVQTPCSFAFTAGKTITLTGGSTFPQQAGFNAWGPVSGDAIGVCGTAYQCSFKLTQDTKATAKIVPIFNLRVQVGTGPGTIRVKKNGVLLVDCTNTAPQSCSSGVFKDTVITIENIAGQLQQFNGYASKTGSAQACPNNRTICTFTLTAESSLVSNFGPIP